MSRDTRSIRFVDLSLLSAEEANDLRALLRQNKISFYETPSGNWGFSMAAIWLTDKEQLERARTIWAEDRKIRHEAKAGVGMGKKMKETYNATRSQKFFLASIVAGGIVLSIMTISFLGEHVPLGRSSDARGGLIELAILWFLLLIVGLPYTTRYLLRRYWNSGCEKRNQSEINIR